MSTFATPTLYGRGDSAATTAGRATNNRQSGKTKRTGVPPATPTWCGVPDYRTPRAAPRQAEFGGLHDESGEFLVGQRVGERPADEEPAVGRRDVGHVDHERLEKSLVRVRQADR